MTRTTLDLDATVLDQLRARAASDGKSMGRVASELLAPELAQGRTPTQPPLRWPARHMGVPRVDLEDKDALWSLLDAEGAE